VAPVVTDSVKLQTESSKKLFERASRLIPGGVNSPVRAFKAVGGGPLFIDHAVGSRMWDADGNSYIDYVGSWGPLILGHANPAVVKAIRDAAGRGSTYGAPTAAEIELAELIAEAMPSIEMVRFVSSGTEATMSAIRVARAFTGRDRIIKFDGCYHGHADVLLAKAGSGIATLGLPDTAGVPASAVENTIVVPFNDLSAVATALNEHSRRIAAIIVEPIAGNIGVVPPAPGFLQGLQELARENGALLIFDEVITGFRVGRGGAQGLYGIRPDLTCLGKIIGGGLPVGVYGGRRDIMSMVAPVGPVYQAGTLSGNPIAMAAGITTLKILRDTDPYPELERRTAALTSGLADAARRAGVATTINRVGSMFTTFFTSTAVSDYATARTSDTSAYARFFHRLLENGIYLAPSQFEAAFVSTAHSDADLEQTISAARQGFGG
jgi:glutamate-1-semialdehyde 2,1-aminomutase